MASTDIYPVAIGDLLINPPPEDSAAERTWLLELLEQAPQAWLTLHPQERRIDPEGFEFAAFNAPTLAHLTELRDVDPRRLPQVYSLAKCAGTLVKEGLGAVIYAPTLSEPESITFSIGDLVQLHLEGALTASRTASQWAAMQTLNGEQDSLHSSFLLNPDDPSSPSPFQTAEPSSAVIPPELKPVLKKFMAKRLPDFEYPVLGRSRAGLLALVFFAPSQAALDQNKETAALLTHFFPRHYHLFFAPRSAT